MHHYNRTQSAKSITAGLYYFHRIFHPPGLYFFPGDINDLDTSCCMTTCSATDQQIGPALFIQLPGCFFLKFFKIIHG